MVRENVVKMLRLRMRAHETRSFAKKTSDPDAKHVLLEIADKFEALAALDGTDVPRLPMPKEKSWKQKVNALQAVDIHIRECEQRLFKHGMLMQTLEDKGRDLTLAHQLQLNLETGLRLMREVRTSLLIERR
jgi:hypothetical protein